MTTVALHTGCQRICFQLAVAECAGRVTIEAFFRAFYRELAAESLFDRGGNFGASAGGQIQAVRISIVANAALKPRAVALQQVRLAGGPQTERPRNRDP